MFLTKFFRWVFSSMVLHLDMGGGGGGAQPDYSKVYEAAKTTTDTGDTLGKTQIDQAREAYNQSMGVANPVIDAQTGLMKQAAAQGTDTYNYMTSRQRPVEDAINAEAMAAGSQQKQTEAADRAVADVRQGTTSAQNQLLRQGLRYGMTPAAIGVTGGAGAVSQGLAEVTAANSARINERDSGFAKKLQAQQMYTPLAAQTASMYGTSMNAGTTAVDSSIKPASMLLTGTNQGANTTLQGRQIAMSGLSGVLNNQTSIANTNTQSSGQATGAIVGAGITAGAYLL